MNDLTKDANIVGEIWTSIAARCAGFPESYWCDLESEDAYSTAVVGSLTGSRCLAPLKADDRMQKYLPGIAPGAIRQRSFGVTEPMTGTDTTNLKMPTIAANADECLTTGVSISACTVRRLSRGSADCDSDHQ